MSGGLPRLVVLGCGFGGYSFLRSLPPGRFETTLVSPRNYFLFTPLLASTVSGTVEFRSIAEPALRRLPHVRTLVGSASGVDWERRTLFAADVATGEGFEVEFDLLVVAAGARSAEFGVSGVAEHALPLADLDGARTIRRRILDCFATAGLPGRSDLEVERLLRFVVCGGGPTGVEIAAELHDLLARELSRAFPGLARRARVLLVEGGDRLLASFDGALAAYTAGHFRREGIELRFGVPVARVTARGVELGDGSSIECGAVLWAVGTTPVPLVESLGLALDSRGRILTDRCFRVAGREAVWAIGDCAAFAERPLPATAQVAQQQGRHLARIVLDSAAGREPKPFRFRSFGMLAYIGGGEALADLPGIKWSGRAAWLFWRSVYLTRLVGLPNKIKVLFDWTKARLFGRDLSRF